MWTRGLRKLRSKHVPMKKFTLAALMLALPVFLAACGYGAKTNSNTTTIDLTNTAVTNTASVNVNTAVDTNVSTNVNAATNTNAAVKAATKDVSITASGFSPSSLTVAAGTTVTWTNASGGDVRVSSDPHPTHTDLPGLDSSTLVNGDTYSFTFTQVGSWGYHDHFSPTTRGTVVVQ